MQPTKFFTDLGNKMMGYIGKKIDELKEAISKPQKISVDVDLGSSTKDFKSAAESLKSLVAGLESWGSDASNASKAMMGTESYFVVMAKSLKDMQKAIEKMSAKDIEVMPAGMKESLTAIVSAVKGMHQDLGEKMSANSMRALEGHMKDMIKAIEGNRTETAGMVKQLADAAMAISRIKIEFPKTIKIDEMQMRQLGQKGGSVSVGTIGGGAPTNGVMYDGRKAVAVTNTALALSATSKLCEEVFITAAIGNSNVVVVGGPSVVFTLASRTGQSLNPGQTLLVKIRDLNKLYINGTSGDAVEFAYTA